MVEAMPSEVLKPLSSSAALQAKADARGATQQAAGDVDEALDEMAEAVQVLLDRHTGLQRTAEDLLHQINRRREENASMQAVAGVSTHGVSRGLITQENK
jgi:hypothetical protein